MTKCESKWPYLCQIIQNEAEKVSQSFFFVLILNDTGPFSYFYLNFGALSASVSYKTLTYKKKKMSVHGASFVTLAPSAN